MVYICYKIDYIFSWLVTELIEKDPFVPLPSLILGKVSSGDVSKNMIMLLHDYVVMSRTILKCQNL